MNEDGRQIADVYVEGRTIKYDIDHHANKSHTILMTEHMVQSSNQGGGAEPGRRGRSPGDRRHREARHSWGHRYTHPLSDAFHGHGEKRHIIHQNHLAIKTISQMESSLMISSVS